MSTLFAVIFCLGAIGSSYAKSEDEIKSWFLQLGMECSQEHPISTNEGLLLAQQKMPNTKNAKCLMACVYRKANWFDDKGMFDVDAAHKLVIDNSADDTEERIANAHKLFDTCKSANDEPVNDGTEGCERAEHLFVCLTKNAPKLGFKIKSFI